MLTDATRGPLRRLLPGRAAVKLAAKLTTRPDTVVTRGAQLAGELAKVGLGRSALEPAKGDRRFKDDAWRGNPAFKRLLQSYLAAGPGGRRADRRRRPGLAQRAPGPLRGRERARRARALQRAADQPGRAEGGARHGRAQLRPRRRELRARHGQAAADPVDGRHVGVHRRRGHRRHAGRGRAAHAGVRAPAVQAADLEGARGAAAADAADDQQVLHRRPGAGSQHDGVRGQARPAGVRDLVAQPDRAPRRLGPRHLRGRGARGARGRRGDHGRGQDPRDGPVRGRHRALRRRRAPRRRGRAGPDRRD